MYVDVKRQEEIIARLESKKVPFIISSQFIDQKNPKGGWSLGDTDCQKLAGYISNSYREEKKFPAYKVPPSKRAEYVLLKRISK